jgi:hypothetical protein
MNAETYKNELEIIRPEAKRAWESNVGIRTEFNGDFDSYLAYKVASSKGLVKVRGGNQGGR